MPTLLPVKSNFPLGTSRGRAGVLADAARSWWHLDWQTTSPPHGKPAGGLAWGGSDLFFSATSPPRGCFADAPIYYADCSPQPGLVVSSVFALGRGRGRGRRRNSTRLNNAGFRKPMSEALALASS